MKIHYLKLRRLAEDQDLKQYELAALAGMKPRTLNKRLNAPENNGSWSQQEITSICRVLHIPQEKIGEYFFPAIEKGETA